MISDDDFGTMLGVLALSYADPLFDTAYLRVRDRRLFRELSRQAIFEADDAHYDADVGAWIFDWRGTARRFLATYAAKATLDDAEAVKWWIRRGYNGIYAPDLGGYLWHRALQWAKHHESWKADVDVDVAERTREFLWRLTNERRSQEHMKAIEDIRDHADDAAADEAVKLKTHMDFYNDYSDPLLLFTTMRGKFVLMDMARAHLEDARLVEALNRIPPNWYADEGKRNANHDFRPLLADATLENLARDHAWRN